MQDLGVQVIVNFLNFGTCIKNFLQECIADEALVKVVHTNVRNYSLSL